MEYPPDAGDDANRYWLRADIPGSIIATSDATNTVGATLYGYSPYGEPNTWSGSRYRYTGQIMIPEAHLYYKARMYDPVNGRFLQTNPIGYDSDVNLYAYAGNDPTDYTDPSGLQDATPVKEVVVTGQGHTSYFPGDFVVPTIPANLILNTPVAGLGSIPAPQITAITVSEVVVTAKPHHDYRLLDQVSQINCFPSAASLNNLTAQFTVPGRNPNDPVRNGEISDATVGPFKGQVVTYINGTTSVNVTLPGHVFYYGSVTRTTMVGSAGAIYVSTHGTGTNSS